MAIFRSIFSLNNSNLTYMFRSYIKIGLRNLVKNRVYSLINLCAGVIPLVALERIAAG